MHLTDLSICVYALLALLLIPFVVRLFLSIIWICFWSHLSPPLIHISKYFIFIPVLFKMLAISLSFKVLILFCLFDCMWKLFSSPHGPHSDSLNPLVEPWRLKTLFPSQPTPERMYSIERKPAETAGKVVAGIWRTCIQQYTCFIHLLYADIQVEMCTGVLIRNLGRWQWKCAA